MRRYPTVGSAPLIIQLNVSLKVGGEERENEFDWVSVGPVRLVKTEKPSSISQGLFENSLQTAVRVSTTAILFSEERTTCDLTLAKGSCVFFWFFFLYFLF